MPYHHWDALTEHDPLIAAIFGVVSMSTGTTPEWRMSAGGGRPDL
ncbi:MAG: hypothetical protein ACRD26_13080 [Vicinamibacterales bacterium]